MIIEKHAFLEMTKDIDEICKPLKTFGIHLFSFRRTFKNGSRINFSNNPHWLQDYYQLKLYETSLFEYDIEQYHSGFSLWPQESSLPVFLHGRMYYGSDNGITLILKNNDFCDFFIFGADYQNKQIVNMYINNLDLIKNFTDYFYSRTNQLLKAALKNVITLPLRIPDTNLTRHSYKKLYQATLKKLFPIFSIKQEPISLTPREMECIKHILSGKTAKEIARELHLSYRTIEYYIDNIRQKTGCRNKYEIIQQFSNSSLA